MKKKNFVYNFQEGAKGIMFLLYLLLYPYFWLIWLLSEDKRYTPNDLIKDCWKRI